MNKGIRIILIFLCTSNMLIAQTLEEKIDELFHLEGSLSMEYLKEDLEARISYAKKDYPNIPNKKYEKLKQEILDNELSKLQTKIYETYKKHYSEKEIDDLIVFYKTPTGSKVQELSKAFYMTWGKFENNWSEELTIDLEEQFRNLSSKNKNYTPIEIINDEELIIGEDNSLSLTIDFGDVTDFDEVTKIVKIKNNEDTEMIFKDYFSMSDEVLTIDWGDKPIKKNEVREIKFILDAKCVSGSVQKQSTLMTNSWVGISLDIRYQAEGRKIKFETSEKKLKFEKFETEYSKPYIFTIENVSNASIKIKECHFSSSVSFIHYEQKIIDKGEKLQIRVIFSRDLMAKNSEENIETNIEVDIQRCNNENYWETIYFKIK
jgi:hypothetical protein